MSERTVPRDRKVCFWCRFFDPGDPSCRRRAPLPNLSAVISKIWDEEADRSRVPSGINAEWPSVKADSDWCGEFEEGNADDTSAREPQSSDEEYDLRVRP